MTIILTILFSFDILKITENIPVIKFFKFLTILFPFFYDIILVTIFLTLINLTIKKLISKLINNYQCKKTCDF